MAELRGTQQREQTRMRQKAERQAKRAGVRAARARARAPAGAPGSTSCCTVKLSHYTRTQACCAPTLADWPTRSSAARRRDARKRMVAVRAHAGVSAPTQHKLFPARAGTPGRRRRPFSLHPRSSQVTGDRAGRAARAVPGRRRTRAHHCNTEAGAGAPAAAARALLSSPAGRLGNSRPLRSATHRGVKGRCAYQLAGCQDLTSVGRTGAPHVPSPTHNVGRVAASYD
jgi:hypothetical protein